MRLLQSFAFSLFRVFAISIGLNFVSALTVRCQFVAVPFHMGRLSGLVRTLKRVHLAWPSA
jgi:hypothetical protein